MHPGNIAAELMAGARYLGSTLLLTQGAGGNNSVKDFASDTLWIKASGINLSQTTSCDDFVGLNLSDVQHTFRDSSLRLMPSECAQDLSTRRLADSIRPGGLLRPSLETGMHACLPQNVVLHTHSVYINALGCMLHGKEAAAKILPGHRWVPYATPGFSLAVAVADETAGEPASAPLSIVLQNHGFVAAASSSEEAIAASETCVAAARDFFGPLDSACAAIEPPAEEMLDLVEQAGRQRSTNPAVPSFRVGRFAVFRSETRVLVDSALFPFVPDDVVYLGTRMWFAPSIHGAAAILHDLCNSSSRFALVVPKTGILFCAESVGLLDAMEESALAHLLIALLISRRGTPSPMTSGSMHQIVSMESEKYRQRIAGVAVGEAARCRS